jgi:hypothetical protein
MNQYVKDIYMNLKSLRIWLVLAVIIVVTILSCAKKPALIKGTVVDDKGKPLGGAAVLSVPQRYNALTDTLGAFSIEGVEPGQYSLLVKYGNDSTLINIGLIEPGEAKVTSIVVTITPPPPPPPIVVIDTTPKPVVEEKPKEIKFIDPVIKAGGNILLLCAENYFSKYEIESSDGLSWEHKKVSNGKMKFPEGRMLDGYFAGPGRNNSETAAGRCIYDDKLWIYSHGPESAPKGGRTISISIPTELADKVGIDSIVIFYGIPPYEKNVPPGSLQFRMLGESASGKIAILVDWQKIDHTSNGSFYKKAVVASGENRQLTYITLEIDSDGEVAGDDFLMRPLIYYSGQ